MGFLQFHAFGFLTNCNSSWESQFEGRKQRGEKKMVELKVDTLVK